MFLWVRLPEGMSATELLPQAVEQRRGLRAGQPPSTPTSADPRTLRLSFVTATVEQMGVGIAALARAILEQHRA
jgi:2-aminoadipate transaminase